MASTKRQRHRERKETKEERYEKELERAEARHNKAAFDSPYVANAYYGTQLEDKSPLYRRVISLVPRRHHGSQ